MNQKKKNCLVLFLNDQSVSMRKGMEKRKENFQPDSLVKKICTKVYDYNSFVIIGNYDFV